MFKDESIFLFINKPSKEQLCLIAGENAVLHFSARAAISRSLASLYGIAPDGMKPSGGN